MPSAQLRISPSEFALANRDANGSDGHSSPAETQRYIIHRMKRAGIPVVGVAFLLDIEYGKLTVEKRDGGWNITWRG